MGRSADNQPALQIGRSVLTHHIVQEYEISQQQLENVCMHAWKDDLSFFSDCISPS